MQNIKVKLTTESIIRGYRFKMLALKVRAPDSRISRYCEARSAEAISKMVALSPHLSEVGGL